MADKISDYEYNKGGYAKHGVSREFLKEARTRTTGPNGKVYRGEAGKQLIRRKLEKQRDYELKKG